jgi:predicted metal-dependent phosphoesterase TrpH
LVNATGKADLHIHSRADDGLATPQQIVEHVERETDLDIIAITDHDEIAGAWEAREVVARGRYRFQVLVGMEITTRQGHLLALGIERPIRMLQEMDRTISLVHEQGGVCILPHPMAWFSMGARQSLVNRLVRQPTDSVYLDGVEVFNPSFAGRVVFKLAERLNRTRWRLAACGGSDSHSLNTIGSAYTTFADDLSIAGLRSALANRTTGYGGAFWSLEDHTSIALPQLYRSMIVTPVARIRRTRGLLREERLASERAGTADHTGGRH